MRDALAGGRPDDWDLTTSARPREVQRLFPRTVPVGIEHGTVGVLARDGRLYEVTTFRRDVETFGRKARVSFSDSLEEDLARRDFTINAVAWHPLTGVVVDPHRGLRDLRDGILRTVGEADERFREDRLRVLRALRFAGRFDLQIDPSTWRAIEESAGVLGELSAERIREELYKVLALRRPSCALDLYQASGVLEHLYPELHRCVGFPADPSRANPDLWHHLLATVDRISPARRTLRLAGLLHDIGRPLTAPERTGPDPDHGPVGGAVARTLMQRLRTSNAETDRVVHLVTHHSPLPAADASDAELRRFLRHVGKAYIYDLFRLRFADWRARKPGDAPRQLLLLWRRLRKIRAEQPPLSTGELAIGGAELRSLGLRPGPRYGEILAALLEQVTDDPAMNRRERLIQEAERMLRSEEDDLPAKS